MLSASSPRAPAGWLRLEGIVRNNLDHVSAAFPLGVLTTVALTAAQASPQAKVLSKPVHLRDLVAEVEKMVAA